MARLGGAALSSLVLIAALMPARSEAQGSPAPRARTAVFCEPYRTADGCEVEAARLIGTDDIGETHCTCRPVPSTTVAAAAAIGPDEALWVGVETPAGTARVSIDAELAHAGLHRLEGASFYVQVVLERVRGMRDLVVARVTATAPGPSYLESTEEALVLVRLHDAAAPEVVWVGIGGTALDCFYDSEEPVDPQCDCLSARTVTVVASAGVVHVRSRIRYEDRIAREPDDPAQCVRPSPLSVDVPIPNGAPSRAPR